MAHGRRAGGAGDSVRLDGDHRRDAVSHLLQPGDGQGPWFPWFFSFPPTSCRAFSLIFYSNRLTNHRLSIATVRDGSAVHRIRRRPCLSPARACPSAGGLPPPPSMGQIKTRGEFLKMTSLWLIEAFCSSSSLGFPS